MRKVAEEGLILFLALAVCFVIWVWGIAAIALSSSRGFPADSPLQQG